MSEPREVRALAQAWNSWWDEPSFPYTSDCCINAARVGVEVLKRLGVPAKPVSVRIFLFNRFAWDLYRKGVPIGTWPEHAWSLGVGDRDGFDEPGRWNGHLMVEGDGFLLDLSARQFDRPGRIVVNEPWVIPPLRYDPDAYTDELGQVLLVKRWPQANGWRNAGGWINRRMAVEHEALRRTQHLLSLAPSTDGAGHRGFGRPSNQEGDQMTDDQARPCPP